MDELSPFERLFTMDICGVRIPSQLRIEHELVIRANRLTGEITSAIPDREDR